MTDVNHTEIVPTRKFNLLESDPGSLKLLVIDDDKWIVKIITNYLNTFGFQVYSATDPYAGIALAIKHIPTIIFLDLLMPELNGFILLKFLKKIELTTNIPVIIISANLDHNNFEEAYLQGVTEYIVKPFKNEMLINKIDDILGFSIMDFFGLKELKHTTS